MAEQCAVRTSGNDSRIIAPCHVPDASISVTNIRYAAAESGGVIANAGLSNLAPAQPAIGGDRGRGRGI